MESFIEIAQIVFVLGLMIYAVYLLFRKIYQERKRQKAVDTEQLQKAQRDASNSPMPYWKYDFWRGEKSLIDPHQNQLDLKLVDLCDKFSNYDDETRTGVRRSIHSEEVDTLLTFGMRASVFAIRQNSVNWVKKGMTALAMVEFDKVDFRDIYVVLSLLYHSATIIAENADRLFQMFADICDSQISKLIFEYLEKTPKDFPSRWGLHGEIETQNGIGYIGWDFKNYQPSYEIGQITQKIGDFVASDQYQPESIRLASELSPTWLGSKKHDRRLEKYLQDVQACSFIIACLRPKPHYNYESQHLMVFLVEVADENTARALLDISQKKESSDYCMVGITARRLFCLVISRSFEKKVKPFETSENLTRFSKGISEILSHYIKLSDSNRDSEK
jgi:hypothetical protein